MRPRKRLFAAIAATALAALVLLPVACGRGEDEVDPAAVDRHLESILAREEADRNQSVVESREREAVREQAITEKVANRSR